MTISDEYVVLERMAEDIVRGQAISNELGSERQLEAAAERSEVMNKLCVIGE